MQSRDFLSPESCETLNALKAAFTVVEDVERRYEGATNVFEARAEKESKLYLDPLLYVQENLREEQTSNVHDLGKLVLSVDKKAITEELANSSCLKVIISAPEYTDTKIDGIDSKKSDLEQLLGNMSEEETRLIESAAIASSVRMEHDKTGQLKEAEEGLSVVEYVQTILQRSIPDFTIAGESSDIIKPILSSAEVDPSAKGEAKKARAGETRKRFINGMKDKVGEMITVDEISKIVHPKDYAIKPRVTRNRVTTMMGSIFDGRLSSYQDSMKRHGIGIQRFAHRLYVEDNSAGTKLSKVNYEYRVYGADVDPIVQDPYEEITPLGIIEHVWELPERPQRGKK